MRDTNAFINDSLTNAAITVFDDVAETFAEETAEKRLKNKESAKTAGKSGSTVNAVKEKAEYLQTFDSSNYANVNQFENDLQNLANRGRKVRVLELKKKSDSLRVTYTVDSIVHVKTFDL